MSDTEIQELRRELAELRREITVLNVTAEATRIYTVGITTALAHENFDGLETAEHRIFRHAELTAKNMRPEDASVLMSKIKLFCTRVQTKDNVVKLRD